MTVAVSTGVVAPRRSRRKANPGWRLGSDRTRPRRSVHSLAFAYSPVITTSRWSRSMTYASGMRLLSLRLRCGGEDPVAIRSIPSEGRHQRAGAAIIDPLYSFKDRHRSYSEWVTTLCGKSLRFSSCWERSALCGSVIGKPQPHLTLNRVHSTHLTPSSPGCRLHSSSPSKTIRLCLTGGLEGTTIRSCAD